MQELPELAAGSHGYDVALGRPNVTKLVCHTMTAKFETPGNGNPAGTSADDAAIGLKLHDANEKYSQLLTLAEECLAAGKPASAVRLAEIAARFAFPGQVGLFASPRLERLLCELGRRIPDDHEASARRKLGDRRQVVHVMTYAKPLGGDSRFVWRWIQQDQASCHSVVITSQNESDNIYQIPEVLTEAVTRSGGFVKALEEPMTDPLAQARELRRFCAGADIILLHLYPYDVVPTIALAAKCRQAKVGFVNHADHAFWVGGSVSDWLVHLREQNVGFVMKRRGLDATRASIVPIPLGNVGRQLDKQEARKALGIAPGARVLLTIASPFKYRSRGRLGFLDLVKPVLKECPECLLFAVGPKAEGEWLAASRETDGRIRALGKVWNNEALVAAADIYLDSVPFASITSVLEAGTHGIPVLGFRAPDDELGLFSAGAPGLTDTMIMASDAASYRAALRKLSFDLQERSTKGAVLQSRILALHSGSGWLNAIQLAYAGMEASNGQSCLVEPKERFEAGALNIALDQLYGAAAFRLPDLIRRGVGTLSYAARFELSFALRRVGLGFCAWNVVPPPFHEFLRRTAPLLKQWWSTGIKWIRRS